MSPQSEHSLQNHDLNPWIGLATLSVLAGLVFIHQAEKGLNQVGEIAESIFQEEQLPILENPSSTSSHIV